MRNLPKMKQIHSLPVSSPDPRPRMPINLSPTHTSSPEPKVYVVTLVACKLHTVGLGLWVVQPGCVKTTVYHRYSTWSLRFRPLPFQDQLSVTQFLYIPPFQDHLLFKINILWLNMGCLKLQRPLWKCLTTFVLIYRWS